MSDTSIWQINHMVMKSTSSLSSGIFINFLCCCSNFCSVVGLYWSPGDIDGGMKRWEFIVCKSWIVVMIQVNPVLQNHVDYVVVFLSCIWCLELFAAVYYPSYSCLTIFCLSWMVCDAATTLLASSLDILKTCFPFRHQ